MNDDRMILVESVTRSQDLSPAVRFKWGDMQGDLTPNEARIHAFIILEAAEAAMTDSFMAEHLRDVGEANPQAIAQLISDLRAARGDWREKRDE